ncbi:hypothetical protein [Novosphingobium sp. SG720]|uniref:hypothetical protein n=1 Tax=Novosphingobium sp. SG720 TaxID=2586998 RepID=UPI001446F9F0|nr:hypothetical protein [Novosphingobium sp. SG720]NKJ43259.1 hypothetical protein [Novosphingobium sp. SG720]
MQGAWSPAAAGVQSLHEAGILSNSNGRGRTQLPPPQGCRYGDYWTTFLVGGGHLALQQGTVFPGDLAVCHGQAWVIQRSPASGAPAGTIKPGDSWQVAANGVFEGRAYRAGGQVVHYGGSYYHFFLPRDARSMAGPLRPGVYWIGDSMAAFARAAALRTMPGVSVDALNSAGSLEIASVFAYRTLTGAADRRTVVVWAGQNTEDKWWETDAALAQIRAITRQRGQRLVVMTPVGRREFTFNGQRLVGKWQEFLKAGSNLRVGLVQTQALVRREFPGQAIDSRAVVLAAVQAHPDAFAGPDLQFPGMSELQTARRFGLVPLSIYQDPVRNGFPRQAKFAGYWSQSGLPSQVAPGAYYVRSGGGVPGNLIAAVNGQPHEFPMGSRNSVVHFAGPNAGIANDALVAAVARLAGN